MKSIRDLQKRLKKKNESISSENRFKYKFKTHIDINFFKKNDLIYHKERFRLCLFTSTKKEIFELIHDKNQHSDINRYYARINEDLYISHLSRKLRQYISHCSKCLLNQTKKHKSYEKLLSISSFAIFFHTIFMNFVMSISGILNTLLTIICKFSKRVTILVEKATFSVER